MADNSFLYSLDFAGDFSALKIAGDYLAKIPNLANLAKEGLADLTKGFKKSADSLTEMHKTMKKSFSLQAATSAWGAASFIYDKVSATWDDITEAMSGRVGSVQFFKGQFGEEGGKMYDELLKIAQVTPLASERVRELGLVFADTFGLDAGKAALFTADVQAYFGQGGEELGKTMSDGFKKSFTDVASGIMPELDSEFGRWLRRKGVFGEMAKSVGISFKSEMEAIEKLRTKFRKGMSDSDKIKVQTAFEKGTLEGIGGKDVGDISERLSGGIVGSLSNFKDRWKDALSSIKWEESPATAKLAKFLNGITKFIQGDWMTTKIRQLTEAFAAMLPNDPEAWGMKFTEWLSSLYDKYIQPIIDFFQGKLSFTGLVTTQLGTLFKDIGTLLAEGFKAAFEGTTFGNYFLSGGDSLEAKTRDKEMIERNKTQYSSYLQDMAARGIDTTPQSLYNVTNNVTVPPGTKDPVAFGTKVGNAINDATKDKARQAGRSE